MNTTPSPSEHAQALAERRAEKRANSRTWAAERFGLDLAEVIDYSSGSAYDKLWVTNRAAAKKAAATVKGRTCNGGFFNGMPLGAITKESHAVFEVMC